MNDNSSFIKEEFEKAKTYWQDKFSGEITGITLPYDFRRSPVYKRRDYKISFNIDIAAKLLSLSKNQDILLYIVLLSVLKFLMLKYMNNGDISIGAPIYAEKDVDETSKRLIIFRDLLVNNMTFKELLLKIKQTVLEGYENQHYVIEDILDALGVTIPVKPLSKVILMLENIHKKEIISDITHSPANDITISILKSGYELTGNIEYNSRLFKEDTIKQIYRHYLISLEQILNDINIKLSEIDILANEEKKQIIYDFNNTAAAYPGNKTVIDLFADQVEPAPDKIAVVEEHCQLTYSELNRGANRMARILQSGGVTVNAIVGLMLDNSLEIAVGILGVLKAGGAYLPLDPSQPRERNKYLIKECGTNTLIIQEDVKEIQQDWQECFSRVNVLVAADMVRQGDASKPDIDIRPVDLAYAVYTSGTTGRPRGVLVDHGGIVNYTFWRLKTYDLTSTDVTLQMLPYYFDGFGSNFYSGLLSGGTLVMIPDAKKLDPDYIRALIIKCIVTNMSVVPPMYRMILAGAKAGELKHLRFVVLAGEKTGVNLIKKSKQIAPDTALVNEYGPSETTVTAAGCWGMNQLNSNVIGHPIFNTHIYILDPSLKSVPLKVSGELCISGPGVARGYLNKPELTDEKFTLNPLQKGERIYHTGDLARWQPDGNIEIIGRFDQQVKIRGYRIELSEIEAHLNRIETVKEALVREYKQSEEENYLCAYFVSNREIDITELKNILSNDLPGYMIPSYFVQLGKIPLTPNGKPDRKALPHPQIKTKKEIVAPGNQLEEKLVEIWAEVLGVEKDIIGINSNFFDLGGHSLTATIMISKVHKELNVKLPLVEVFKTPIIKDLSQYIKNTVRDDYTAIERAEEREYYGVTSAQKRLFVLWQIAPDSTAYNMPLLRVLKGKIDKNRLETAFVKMIERHDSLRTSFVMVEGEPVQKIHKNTTFAGEYYDLHKPGDAMPDSVTGDDDILKNSIRPFDLSQAPLLRVGLIKLPHPPTALRGHPSQEGKEDKYLLIVDMHHIITDGISGIVLEEEFVSLYAGEELPPIRLRYGDYSQWQRRQETKEAFKQQEEYWLHEFGEEIPVLSLPIDFPRPPIQSFEGSIMDFDLNAEETKALTGLAESEGLTLFMVLLAVFNIFLSKISGQEDIVVGVPTAGRKHADLNRVIGMFVNTLPMRNYPSGEKTFAAFLGEIKEKTLKAFENQDYHFETLVEKVDVKRDMSRNPLFNVMFVLQNFFDTAASGNIPKSKMKEVEIGRYSHEHRTSKFDLSLNAVESNETLYFTFEYCTKLFEKAAIQRLVKYFKSTISSMVHSPGEMISGIEIITPEEKKKVLYDFNNTKTGYPRNKFIHQLFEEQAVKSPDTIAAAGIGRHHGQVTYRELNEKTEQLARVLHVKGVETDRIVAIMAHCSLEMITGILAVLKAGGAYLPIDPGLPEERKKYMLADSSAGILMSQLCQLKWVSGDIEVIELSNMIDTLTQTALPLPRVNPAVTLTGAGTSSLAYVIYTSGSTGKPKAVPVGHVNVVSLVKETNYIRWEAVTRLLLTGSISFDITTFEIWGTLLNGLTLYLAAQDIILDGRKLKEVLSNNQIDILHLIPQLFNQLAAQHPGIFAGLHYFLVGGDLVRPHYINKIRDMYKNLNILHMYGPTENTTFSTFHPADKKYENFIPIGKPISNSSVYIVDKYHKLVPPAVQGELCIGGNGVSRGYLNNPELTAEKFVKLEVKVETEETEAPRELIPNKHMSHMSYIYKTGDLARWLPDGNIEFLGREDTQVKIKGIRIELGEIESQLLGHQEIKDAMVIDRQNETGEKFLCAYFIADREIPVSELRKYLSLKLPESMTPSYYIQMEKFPLTSNGKTDKKRLPPPGESRPTLDTTYTAPRNDLENAIAHIWKEVLHKDKVGIQDNFFDLGGNSLTIVNVNSQLKTGLAIDIPVVKLFRYPTIESLATYINQDTAVGIGNEEIVESVNMMQETMQLLLGGEDD